MLIRRVPIGRDALSVLSLTMTNDAHASQVYAVEKRPASFARRVITSVLSVLSIASAEVTLPQWSRYEIRDRMTGRTLRAVNNDVAGRDIGWELDRDLNELDPVEFARKWKLPS